MNVNEAVALASRLRGLVRRANTFGPKSREDILEEILFVVKDLEDYADRLDEKMYEDYLNTEAYARERYEDAIVSNGL